MVVGLYLTKEDFLKKAIEIHGIKYDYSLIGIYRNTSESLEIKCPIHGVF
jgi:hypothetical protein